MEDDIRTVAEAHEEAALLRSRAVHADPDAPATAEQKPLPEAICARPADEKSPAEWAYERLILYIQNFEEQLDPDEEIAMGMIDGGAGLLRIEGIGFFDPDIVSFYGRDPSGGRMQLVQHVTQLNVTLRALPKPKGEEKAQRIGFRLARGLSEPDADEDASKGG
ncbi:DUF6173 family protein [Vannielia litorea]|uniref:DUF6173 family protein n=1 Tax=Vannielia litorea TaxID=1217970 RepID=UPI001BCCC371|nr:DUF6173 family protein [Vannielia litorea]MBS8226802.1 hypothetical protein [Vannielia litorea]